MLVCLTRHERTWYSWNLFGCLRQCKEPKRTKSKDQMKNTWPNGNRLHTRTKKRHHFLTNKCSFSSRLPNPIPKGEVTSHGRMFKAEQLRYHKHINSTVHPSTSFASLWWLKDWSRNSPTPAMMVEGLISKIPNRVGQGGDGTTYRVFLCLRTSRHDRTDSIPEKLNSLNTDQPNQFLIGKLPALNLFEYVRRLQNPV